MFRVLKHISGPRYLVDETEIGEEKLELWQAGKDAPDDDCSRRQIIMVILDCVRQYPTSSKNFVENRLNNIPDVE